MPEDKQALQNAVAALQAKNAQLDDKLRALEQSYTIDKRTVYIVGAALSVLIVAFSGYSLTQMPEKVIEKLEAGVAARTGKSIDERMKAIDATLLKAQGQLAAAKAPDAVPESVSKSLDALAQRVARLEAPSAIAAAAAASSPAVDKLAERVAQLEKRRLAVVAAAAPVSQKRLKYSDLGYAIPEGYQLECDPGAWITAMRFYTNKDSKFAGFVVDCKMPTIGVR